MAQLMPLPLTVSCFIKIQNGFTFLIPAYLGSPGQRAVKWVCAVLETPTEFLLLTGHKMIAFVGGTLKEHGLYFEFVVA